MANISQRQAAEDAAKVQQWRQENNLMVELETLLKQNNKTLSQIHRVIIGKNLKVLWSDSAECISAMDSLKGISVHNGEGQNEVSQTMIFMGTNFGVIIREGEKNFEYIRMF